MAKFEILSGVERQRRWPTALKLSILQEAFGSGGSVSAVARKHDILPQQIYTWRRKFGLSKSSDMGSLVGSLAPTCFVPVSIAAPEPVAVSSRVSETHHDCSKSCGVDPNYADPSYAHSCAAEIVLRNGRTIKIAANIDREMLASLIICVETT